MKLHRDAADRIPLATPPPYYTIVELILLHMEILCFHWERSDERSDFERAVFCVRVSRPAFDWFFNSRNGYRARYYVSEWEGLRANQVFVQSAAADLVASELVDNDHRQQVRDSLLSETAEVWLAEAGNGQFAKTCATCREGWRAREAAPTAEIWNDRWESVDSMGSRAPYADRLRIMGAYIDDRNDVLLPSNGRERARRINATGWE